MKPMYKQWKAAALCLCAGLVAACTNELSEPDGLDGLRPGDVALQWLPANMAVKNVSTRATDPKTAAEQQINNIHVFVFDAAGNYLEAQGHDAFQGYRFQEGNATMVFRRDMFEQSTQDASNATVVVLANMPKDTFEDGDSDGHPDEITDLTSFNSFIYSLPSFTTSLPEGGLPMMVSKTGIDFTPDPEGQAGVRVETLQLKSLMARIDLNFKLEPAQASGSSDYPSLRFDRVGVGNFPAGGTVIPQLNGTTTETDDTKIDLKKEDNVSAPDFTGRLIREGEPQSLTLYMFEHARAAKALGEVFPPNGKYPDNITEAEKQRYKNRLAADDAAYIELEGVYTNHNDYKYKVTYRLYPGADATDDFTIKSNCQYKNNITVSGITVNGEGNEALLDTRVNIDTQANPYFIQMLRERGHDAHFNVTPMDVYIYAGGSVTVEIEEADNKKWIRMEPMYLSPTANGEKAATEAGDGKRPYFTEDLLTELARQENSTSYTVTAPSADATYEERIYFYIDENVPTSNDGQEVPDRDAKLRITYTSADGSKTHTREIPIVQAGMLPVEYKQIKGETTGDYTFYIEKYEEYLEHYDGKDLYNHTYDGLAWGFTGIMTDLNKINGNEYMRWGWRNTMTIMQKFRNAPEYSDEKKDITLNDRPRGATEYCYNKNKRNAQGQVETCHWYHPTIRELENAMDKYYATDSVFQENWYWSSNPGPYGKNGGNTTDGQITWTGEHENYARATKSMYQGNGTFKHAESEADKPYERDPSSSTGWDTPLLSGEASIGVTAEHVGGYARRTQVFRIRAAYIYQKPSDRNAPDLDNINNY